jgi:CTP:molybdopterin cytidylyltransferase MocA
VTVAAVILARPGDDVVAPLLGQPRVRRLVDIAWSGGALPIVVVAPDPRGDIAAAVAGSVAVVTDPALSTAGPAGHIAAGVRVALAEVSSATAALIWPARLAWVDPETLTSLIQAHGADAAAVLRPTFRGVSGWPVLLPVMYLEALAELGPDVAPGAVFDLLAASGIPLRQVELGDPGATHDVASAPDTLPAYTGPLEPAGGPPPEWGDGVAHAGEAGEAEAGTAADG